MNGTEKTRRPSLWAILAVAVGVGLVVFTSLDEFGQLLAGQFGVQAVASAAAAVLLTVGLGGMIPRRAMR